MAFYSSFGAAGEVTGSCHLLEINHLKILIDCGLFQGKEEYLNEEEFGFDPKEIDYLIVTHAHLDHIGRIPLLVKKGFNKKIISTHATYDLTKLMLNNAANILQEKEKPLYYQNDVEPALSLFRIFLEYNESLELEDGITVSFKNAGHILGSVSVKIDYTEDNMKKSTLLSGDIGQKTRLITSPIEYWDNANYIFIESTYGDRVHKNLDISVSNFKQNIINVVEKKGVVVLPTFALERTQEILYILKQMSEENLLENIPVYLDAPLAINITKVFLKYSDLLNEDISNHVKNKYNPFNFKELNICSSKEESIQINKVEGAKIIIAGSGMCEGGRVKYHLSRYLQSSQNIVIFVGYQVQGTLGRKILDGQKKVTIDDYDVEINAQIRLIDGFSAHADQNNLINFIKDFKDIYCIYLIHGDKKKLEIFKEKIENDLIDNVHIVKKKEKIYI
jgi:metallo-beta-lactamase family protein